MVAMKSAVPAKHVDPLTGKSDVFVLQPGSELDKVDFPNLAAVRRTLWKSCQTSGSVFRARTRAGHLNHVAGTNCWWNRDPNEARMRIGHRSSPTATAHRLPPIAYRRVLLLLARLVSRQQRRRPRSWWRGCSLNPHYGLSSPVEPPSQHAVLALAYRARVK